MMCMWAGGRADPPLLYLNISKPSIVDIWCRCRNPCLNPNTSYTHVLIYGYKRLTCEYGILRRSYLMHSGWMDGWMDDTVDYM